MNQLREFWLRSRVVAEVRRALDDPLVSDPTDPIHMDGFSHTWEYGCESWIAQRVGVAGNEVLWALDDLTKRGVLDTYWNTPRDLVTDVWLVAPPPWVPPIRPPMSLQDRKQRRRVASAAISERAREMVLARDRYQCVLCGADDDLTLDHIFPQSLGGSGDPLNLRVLCRTCNSRKGARIPEAVRLLRVESC